MLFGKPVQGGAPPAQPSNSFAFGQPAAAPAGGFGAAPSSGFLFGQPVGQNADRPSPTGSAGFGRGASPKLFGAPAVSPPQSTQHQAQEAPFGQPGRQGRQAFGGPGQAAGPPGRISPGRGAVAGRGSGAFGAGGRGAGRGASPPPAAGTSPTKPAFGNVWKRVAPKVDPPVNPQRSPGQAGGAGGAGGGAGQWGGGGGAGGGGGGGDDAAKKAARLARFQTASQPSPPAGPPPSARQSYQQQQQASRAWTPTDDMAEDADVNDGDDMGSQAYQVSPSRSDLYSSPAPRSPSPSSWTPTHIPASPQVGSDMDGDEFCIVGTCKLMCPVEERQRREANAELHPLERVDPDNAKLTHEDLIVKKAVRNYDEGEQKPELFRTLPALIKTADHLRRVMDWTDADHPAATPSSVHSFLWDRYREVRKELMTQRLHRSPSTLPFVVATNEEICRYLLISQHELAEEKGFQRILNQEQMIKCLTDLKDLYELAVELDVPCDNSAEFKCYMCVLNYGGVLNKAGNKRPNKQDAIQVLRSFTYIEQATPWFSITCLVLRLMSVDDVRAFWRLSHAAPAVLACVLYTHMHMMQQRGMAMGMKAYDGSVDPTNIIPAKALTPLLDAGPKLIASKARNLGAEVVSAGPGAAPEIRFPYLDTAGHRPSMVPNPVKKMPWISSAIANLGPRSNAACYPPAFDAAFISLFMTMTGRDLSNLPPPRAPPPRPAASPALALTPRPAIQGVQGSAGPSKGFGVSAGMAQQAAAVFGTVAGGAGGGSGAAAAAQAQAGGLTRTPGGMFGGTAAAGVAAAGAAGGQQADRVATPYATSFKPTSPGFGVQGGAVDGPGSSSVDQRSAAAIAAEVAEAQAREARAMAQAAAFKSMAEASERARVEAEQRAGVYQQQTMQQAQEATLRMHREAEQFCRAAQQEAEQLRHLLATQTAQLEAISLEKEAVARALEEAQLREQEQHLTQALRDSLQRRVLSMWRQATEVAKQREAKRMEQMSRCRIVTLGSARATASSPRDAHDFSHSFLTPGTVQTTKKTCRRISNQEAFNLVTKLAPEPVHPHLPLNTLLLPLLQRAVQASGWKARTARSGGQFARAQHGPALWKVVVCSGIVQVPGGPTPPAVSALHRSAAQWMRSKLSAGRGDSRYHPPAGDMLALLHTSDIAAANTSSLRSMDDDDLLSDPSSSPSISLCIEDVSAAAVAAEVQAPAEHSSVSMGATSAIMLLVSGPETSETETAGNGHTPIPEPVLTPDVATSLGHSWEALHSLLGHTAPQVHVPVVILALTTASGCKAVASHFRDAASHWPIAVSSRMSSCQVLPLLPQTQAEGVLVQGLCQLASQPPNPFLIAAGCPDTTPASNPHSPRWAAAAGLLGRNVGPLVSGPPTRVSLEWVVKQLLEQVLSEHTPPAAASSLVSLHLVSQPSADSLRAQELVSAFNASLEALSRGIHATASHVLAAWGMPSPELCHSPATPAPLCWGQPLVQRASDLVLKARVALSSLMQQLQPTDGAPGAAQAAYRVATTLLHASFQQWVTSHLSDGPMWAYLLPRYLPGASPAVPISPASSLTSNGSGGQQAAQHAQHGSSSGQLHHSSMFAWPSPAARALAVGAGQEEQQQGDASWQALPQQATPAGAYTGKPAPLTPYTEQPAAVGNGAAAAGQVPRSHGAGGVHRSSSLQITPPAWGFSRPASWAARESTPAPDESPREAGTPFGSAPRSLPIHTRVPSSAGQLASGSVGRRRDVYGGKRSWEELVAACTPTQPSPAHGLLPQLHDASSDTPAGATGRQVLLQLQELMH